MQLVVKFLHNLWFCATSKINSCISRINSINIFKVQVSWSRVLCKLLYLAVIECRVYHNVVDITSPCFTRTVFVLIKVSVTSSVYFVYTQNFIINRKKIISDHMIMWPGAILAAILIWGWLPGNQSWGLIFYLPWASRSHQGEYDMWLR